MAVTSDHRQSANALEPSSGAALLAEIHRMRILVADNAEGASALADMLTESGFTHVQITHNIDETLDALRAADRSDEDIDLLLFNAACPAVGGYDLCRAVRAHPAWSETPIVALQPRADRGADPLVEGFDAGATDVAFLPQRRIQELVPHVIAGLLLKRERDLRRSRETELESELAERKVMEARLQYLVSHDELTGLFNRRRLEQVLDTAVKRMQKQHISGAIIYIDLDQFKIINDLEGHAAGDRLLMSVSNILRSHLKQHDILSRVSSDEYAVLIENTNEEGAMHLAETLRRAIDNYHFSGSEHIYRISASIGVLIMHPEDEVSASEAMARSAQACFEAKAHGRNLVHLFDHNDLETSYLRTAVGWVPRIREALENDRFRLVFQPIIDLKNDQVVSYETLIRMVDADGTLVAPNTFIPVAERMGLIHEIDLWVVRHAIDTLHRLPPEQSHICLNVNLSTHAFQDPQLLAIVCERLAHTGVAAQRITFEITETAAVANYDQTRNMVNDLRALGCRFALDDFGTGFSSFNYLKQFPVDYLKLDGSFISNLLHDPIDQRLVKSMIEVGLALNKRIVAEFVENAATLALLKEFGADRAQGNHIGLPLDYIPAARPG
ncbi:MAG: EAL domain-containing protein [Chromatiales bacterium]|jgi:diguanylate cyclase (GGDEF)-like protein|nr:EAL domain-containing protein [Chromatiales bacterium]